MATLYVETYRPCFPYKGVCVRVHKEKGFNRDALSPDMTSVWEVQGVKTKEDAIACVIEKAAGCRTTVRRLF
jgi:hypothetical protein